MKFYALFFSVLTFFSGTYAVKLTVKNNCPTTIWPATLTSGGSTQLSNTGFKLAAGATTTIVVPSPWNGRVWGRTGCTSASGRFSCATADCGSGQVACNGKGEIPPATLAEFNLAANGGQDFFDISLVDGFNLDVSISPQGGSGTKCVTTSCKGNVNAVCPSQLAVKGSNGATIACKSACDEFHQPQYCCTGEYNSAATCKPTNYSMIFKKQCPMAYSYAYDDKSSLYSCTGGPSYVITFCP